MYKRQDYKRGLQLYSSGVLIMDKCEDLLPDCFGFVKGIVDSPDLSLNISREMLQKDRQLKACLLYTSSAAKADIVALDKTGTITTGNFSVTDIEAYGCDEKNLLSAAYSVESKSEHPLAKAICAYEMCIRDSA